jgi:sigma-E factor negative regulatory protein RseB
MARVERAVPPVPGARRDGARAARAPTRMRSRLLVLLLAGAVGLPLAAAEVPPESLLALMSAALRQHDYQGSFVYEHGGRLDALRVYHAGGQPERERLVGLTGARSEIVRDGNAITCVRSDGAALLVHDRPGAVLLPLLPETGRRGATRSYLVRAAGADRVAGYPARIVEIVPRDRWRYGYRIWLEQDSHLPLRSAMLDADGHTLEQFMFVALQIGATPREGDLAASSDEGLRALPDEQPLPASPRWTVGDAPPGFFFLRSQRPPGGAADAEHQIYSDGLATVSVYVEPDANARAQAGTTWSRGVLSIHAGQVDGCRVTVVGDVPGPSVERMARSVRPAALPTPRTGTGD